MPHPGVGILVLAAGGSSRMGRPKQLLDYRGKPLVRHVAETALAVAGDRVVVVVGAEGGKVGGRVRDLPVRVVLNKRWEAGIGSSIHAGMNDFLTEPSPIAAAVGVKPEGD
jgi:molybdenum cofactor cytidylyltransferase